MPNFLTNVSAGAVNCRHYLEMSTGASQALAADRTFCFCISSGLANVYLSPETLAMALTLLETPPPPPPQGDGTGVAICAEVQVFG